MTVQGWKPGVTAVTLASLTVTLTLFLVYTSTTLDIPLTELVYYFSQATFASPRGVLRTLQRATPLLLATVGLIVAFKSGVWNIGGEGQIAVGAVTTAGICLYFDMPSALVVIASIFLGFLAAGLYGSLAGVLRSKWNVNEVVVTMMQNFMALALLEYLINGPWNWGRGLYPRTAMIPTDTWLPQLAGPLNVTVVLSIAVTMLVYLLFRRTLLGFELRAIGGNLETAISVGMNTGYLLWASMLLSGGLCGLAGSSLVLGEFHRLQGGITGNYGFYAIASAFIAGTSPVLALLSSLLIAFIIEGTLALTALGVPHMLGEAVVGIIFLVVLIPRWIRRNS